MGYRIAFSNLITHFLEINILDVKKNIIRNEQ